MSGIAGIMNRDGAPVSRPLLNDMVAALRFRGPDGEGMRVQGSCGFVHTLFRTTWESERESQPFSLGGGTWITADCRLDARGDLIARLGGTRDLTQATDPELILRAYHRWGEDCVEHIFGDFSFAIWDSMSRKLFCARDHFGIRLFYYSLARHHFIFSNTLNCVRLDESISRELNEQFIGDFLLFGYNQEVSTTAFRDIQLLPPAHTLTLEEGRGLKIKRYWRLPIDEPLYSKRSSDYVDRFRELLERSVGDRLRTDRVGVYMSGGLDSPTLATTALRLLKCQNRNFDLRAHTIVYDRLIPDQERHYAGLVAAHLNIPIHFTTADNYGIFEGCQDPILHTPEPVHAPFLKLSFDQNQLAAQHCRVMLYGEGPDNLLTYEWRPYLRWLWRRRRVDRIGKDLFQYLVQNRQVPLWESTWRRLCKSRKSVNSEPQFPSWLADDFVERLRLRDRWEEVWAAAPPSMHPVRPHAYQSMNHVLWREIFVGFETHQAQVNLEVRHPFLNVELVRYLLTIPVIPWCRKKQILRIAMRGALPDEVLARAKTPLAPSPLVSDRSQLTNLTHLRVEDVREFVSFLPAPLPCLASQTWIDLNSYSLAWWFSQEPSKTQTKRGGVYSHERRQAIRN